MSRSLTLEMATYEFGSLSGTPVQQTLIIPSGLTEEQTTELCRQEAEKNFLRRYGYSFNILSDEENP